MGHQILKLSAFAGIAAACMIGACADGSGVDDPGADSPDAGAGALDGGVIVVKKDSGSTTSGDGSVVEKDGGTTSDSGTNVAACKAPNNCNTARDVGGVNGDKGNDQISATGVSAEWLSFRVSEANKSLFGGQKEKFLVTLTAPAGAKYELNVYLNKDSDVLECSTVSSSANGSSPYAVGYEWGEGAIPNGSDDSRTVSVEVKYVSGPCGPSAKWAVDIQGNPP